MGFHWPELFVIGVLALLIFGPRRLPEMGNALGRALVEFKKSMNEIPPPAPSETPDCTTRTGRQAEPTSIFGSQTRPCSGG